MKLFYFISAMIATKMPHNITIVEIWGYKCLIYIKISRQHSFGIHFTILHNAFVCRAALTHTFETCSLKLRLSSIRTPSSFTWDTGLINSSPILRSKTSSFWRHLNNIAWNLDGFAFIWLFSNHFNAKISAFFPDWYLGYSCQNENNIWCCHLHN